MLFGIAVFSQECPFLLQSFLIAAALIFLISSAAIVDGRRSVAEEESTDADTPAEKSTGDETPAADDSGEETSSPASSTDAGKGELTTIQQETADIDPAG